MSPWPFLVTAAASFVLFAVVDPGSTVTSIRLVVFGLAFGVSAGRVSRLVLA